MLRLTFVEKEQRRLAVGGWRLAVGGWRRLAVGRWRRLAVGRWPLAVGVARNSFASIPPLR